MALRSILARTGAVSAILCALLLLAPAARPAAQDALGQSAQASLLFIENTGQFDARVYYQIRGAGGAGWLAGDGIWLTQWSNPLPSGAARALSLGQRESLPVAGQHIRIRLEGVELGQPSAGYNAQNVRINYYLGADPGQWRTAVPVWGGVRYLDVLPGLDLNVEGNQSALRLQFSCRSSCTGLRALPRLVVDGANVMIQADGALALNTGQGRMLIDLPPAVDSAGESVAGLAPVVANASVETPAYADEIEPTFDSRLTSEFAGVTAEIYYGTLLGGSDVEYVEAISVDSAGRATVFGDTRSLDFPTTPGAFDDSYNGGSAWGDVFVARLDADGANLEYATYIGGSAADLGLAGASDDTGAVVVTGRTSSADFPTTPGAYDRTHNGDEDAYLVRLDDRGALDFSTYLGGSASHPDPGNEDAPFAPSGLDAGLAVTLRDDGRFAVAGITRAADFPVTPGAFDLTNQDYCSTLDDTYPCADAFVAVISANGGSLEHATFFGGSDDDLPRDMVLAPDGQLIIVGDTFSTDLPVTKDAVDDQGGQDRDAFVARLGPDLAEATYVTYLGGAEADGDGWFEGDKAFAVAIDAAGHIIVAGETWSSDFPTTPGSFDRTRQGGNCPTNWYGETGTCPDAFVLALRPDGKALAFSTLLGGTGDSAGDLGYEAATSVVLDDDGNPVVAGFTRALDFPTTAGAYATEAMSDRETFVVLLTGFGRTLEYSTFVNTVLGAGQPSLARDPLGNIYLAQQTMETTAPTTAGAYDVTFNGAADALVMKLALSEAPSHAAWVEKGAQSATGPGISASSLESDFPKVVEAGDGSIVVAWEESTPAGDSEIYVRRWNGSAWSELGQGSASQGGISDNSGDSASPAVAAAANGSLYVAWSDDSGTSYDIYVRHWDGSAWREVGAGSAAGSGVSATPGHSRRPALLIGPNGELYLFWDDDSDGDTEIYAKVWDGAEWAEVGRNSAASGGISDNGGGSSGPHAALDRDGLPVVAWTDRSDGDTEVYVRAWNGVKWNMLGKGSAIGGGISANDGASRLGDLTAGPGGDLFAVWADDSDGDFEIYVLRWNGNSWLPIGNGSAAENGISSSTGDSLAPSISVGADGVPIVSWYDTTPDAPEIYVRRWSGSRWEEVTAGSARGGGVSDNPGASANAALTTSRERLTYLVWADNSRGEYEIYVRQTGELPCYALQLLHFGEGNDPVASPDRSPACPAGKYAAGAHVIVQAQPATGWEVVGWNGTDNDDDAQTSNAITMPANDHLAFAVYAPELPACYALTLTYTGNGSKPVATPTQSEDCAEGYFVAGEVIALEAKPAAGWHVESWRGTAYDAGTAISNSVAMPVGDHVVSVKYAVDVVECYALTLAHSGEGGDPEADPSRSTDCDSGEYVRSERIELVARPNAGWRLERWKGTDDDLSSDLTNTVTMGRSDRVVVATYGRLAQPRYTVSIPFIRSR